MSDTTLSKEEKQYKRLTGEPVARLVLELGLPTTISMLITNLYNMVDTWFVSQLGTSATGAVGVVFGLMAIIQAFGFMFGHGAGSNISRLLGAHEKERAKAFSATGFYLAVGAGVLIAIIGILDLNGLCRLLGSTETILPYARIYAFYILVSAPAMASSCVMNNVLRYEGYANLAMVGLVSGGILNMAGDAILMWGLNLGIRGAALSTMISQYVSFGILLFFFLRGKTQSSLAPKYFTWEFAVHKNNRIPKDMY
jgi:Na+-driven multidrug efflux pump